MNKLNAVRIITYPQNAGTTTTGLLRKQRGCIYSKLQDEYYAGKEARHGDVYKRQLYRQIDDMIGEASCEAYAGG